MFRYIIFFLFILSGFELTGQNVKDSSIVHEEFLIYYDTDVFALGSSDKEALDSLILKANEESYKFYVDAHTDDVGTNEYNLELSNKRKTEIVSYLISQNIDQQNIISNFHGETLKVAFENNDQSRQKNRRAVVQLITVQQFVYVQGEIVDDETLEGIPAEILIRNNTFESSTKTNSDGRFKLLAPVDQIVSIEVVAKDYFIETNTIKITVNHAEKSLKIPLPKAEIGDKFTFEQMLFRGGRSIMLPQSKPALQHLKRFMFVNSDHCIEIAGHINHPSQPKVETTSFNFDLSVARANVVYYELYNIGVTADRMLARGYGNWEMVFPFARMESQMRKNRRVEIIISDCDSTRLISNHEVVNKDVFNKPPPNQRVYVEAEFEKDILHFPAKAQKDLKRQIKKMKKKNIDPSQFTYMEMLIALPDLPKPKKSID